VQYYKHFSFCMVTTYAKYVFVTNLLFLCPTTVVKHFVAGFFIQFWLQNSCENKEFRNFLGHNFTPQCRIDPPRQLEMLQGLLGVLMDSPWMTCAFLNHHCHLFSWVMTHNFYWVMSRQEP